MKNKVVAFLILSLFIMSCSENKREVSIYSSSCAEVAKLLDGNYSYVSEGSESRCTVEIEGTFFNFYQEAIITGVKLGLAMSVNRDKMKEYYECTNPKEVFTAEQSSLLYRNCIKKLNMKDFY